MILILRVHSNKSNYTYIEPPLLVQSLWSGAFGQCFQACVRHYIKSCWTLNTSGVSSSQPLDPLILICIWMHLLMLRGPLVYFTLSIILWHKYFWQSPTSDVRDTFFYYLSVLAVCVFFACSPDFASSWVSRFCCCKKADDAKNGIAQFYCCRSRSFPRLLDCTWLSRVPQGSSLAFGLPGHEALR